MEKNTALEEIQTAHNNAELAAWDLERAVIRAALGGTSWTEIGKAIGTSKQTAFNRYRDRVAPYERIENGESTLNKEDAKKLMDRLYNPENSMKHNSEKDLSWERTETTPAADKAAAKKLDAPAPAEPAAAAIFLDGTALANDDYARAAAIHGKRTVDVFKQYAADRAEEKARKAKRKPKPETLPEFTEFRPVYTLTEQQPETAQPGTGKGPHLCPNCQSSNHKTTSFQEAAFHESCTPTKYDTPAITAYMKERTK